MFGRSLEDLGMQYGAKLVPEWEPITDLILKTPTSQKHLQSLWMFKDSEGSGDAKIDENSIKV